MSPYYQLLREAVQSAGYSIGFLSWQQLGNIQIASAKALPISAELRTFVASALQRQFADLGIATKEWAADYLEHELTRAQIDCVPSKGRQSSADRERETWRLSTSLVR